MNTNSSTENVSRDNQIDLHRLMEVCRNHAKMFLLWTVIMGIFDRAALEAYLNVPEDQELVALIAVGYPDETPNAPRRKTVTDLLTYVK